MLCRPLVSAIVSCQMNEFVTDQSEGVPPSPMVNPPTLNAGMLELACTRPVGVPIPIACAEIGFSCVTTPSNRM